MASWVMLEEQAVRLSPRAVSFTVVCERCVALFAGDGYAVATVHGTLPLEQARDLISCPHGHQLRVQRDAS